MTIDDNVETLSDIGSGHELSRTRGRIKAGSSTHRGFYVRKEGCCAHGSGAITASRHHLYLRDTAKSSRSRIVTAQGPYSRRLALIGPPPRLLSFFLSFFLRPASSESRSFTLLSFSDPSIDVQRIYIRPSFPTRLFRSNFLLRTTATSSDRVVRSFSNGTSGNASAGCYKREERFTASQRFAPISHDTAHRPSRYFTVIAR